MFLLAGVILAMVLSRIGCARKNDIHASSTFVPGSVSPDSIGAWVEQADSIMGLDAQTDSTRSGRAFDLWARALAASLRTAGDTLPGAQEARRTMDSLQIRGEAERAVGNAGGLGVSLRPHAASRARRTYFLYSDRGRVGYLPVGLENVDQLHYAAWRAGTDLFLSAVGMRPFAGGSRLALTFLKSAGPGGWVPWDTLPPLDSLGTPGSTPSFEQPSDGPPLLVFRFMRPGSPFEECPTCPHRWYDRVWRPEGATLRFMGEQMEDTPYAAMVSFVEALARGDNENLSVLSVTPGAVENARALPIENSIPGGWQLDPGQQLQDSVLTVSRRGAGKYVFRLRYDSARWKVDSVYPQAP